MILASLIALRRLAAARGVAMIAAALLVSACAGGLDNAGLMSPSTPANDGFDARETDLGRREHPRIVAAFGGTYVDPGLQAYLDEMVSELRAVSERPELGYSVTVLNSPSINAFSLPGGYIYVTQGLLSLANDSSEMAAVLAHEMAHVTARHAIQREEQAVSATIVGQVVADAVQDPDAGAAALALTRGRLAQFSRRQELEADIIGMRTAARAGYDPNGAISFLRGLARQTELHSKVLNQDYDPGRVDIFATHPATPQRILQAEREARQIDNEGLRRDRAGYLEVLDGLPYGDDPREGFVQGRTFLHPQLGITFTAVPGYGLENTPRAVVGFSERGDIMRFDTVTVSSRTSLSDYLAEDAVRGGEVTSVEELTINGQEAAVARVSSDAWEFKVVAIRGRGTSVYRFILASRDLDQEREDDLLETAFTFRLLDRSEARRVRQPVVRVVRAGPGDTVETLAARMPFEDLAVERLRALNGLSPSDRIRQGDLVKIISR